MGLNPRESSSLSSGTSLLVLGAMSYPILLRIGPVTIYSYGLLLTLAILGGVFLFWRRARREGFAEESILDLALVTLISGVVGARVLFILANFPVFRSDPLDVFRSFNTGLSFLGGLIFGTLGFFLFTRRHTWSFSKLTDLAVPGLALAQALGSLGLLLSGFAQATVGEEAILFFLVFLILSLLERRQFSEQAGTKLGTGFLTLLWLFLFSSIRFVTGFYRAGAGGLELLTRVLSGLSLAGSGLVLGFRYSPDWVKVWGWVKKARFPKPPLSWLSREKLEITEEQQRLRAGNLSFRFGRTESNAELGEEAQEQISHTYARAMAEFLRDFGRQINKALSRARKGKYGICECCGKQISLGRLKAYPAATSCIACEEKRES